MIRRTCATAWILLLGEYLALPRPTLARRLVAPGRAARPPSDADFADHGTPHFLVRSTRHAPPLPAADLGRVRDPGQGVAGGGEEGAGGGGGRAGAVVVVVVLRRGGGKRPAPVFTMTKLLAALALPQWTILLRIGEYLQ